MTPNPTVDEASSQSNRDLEEVLFRDPDDLTAWRVYADWLCERGDPRGELMRVHLATPIDRVKEREIIDRHFNEWLSPFNDGVIGPHWERGFVEAMDLRRRPKHETVDLAELSRIPSLRFVRRLDIRALGVAASGLERFRALQRLTLHSMMVPFLPTFARMRLEPLQTLRFDGDWTTPHPSVVRPSEQAMCAAMDAFASMELPSLRRFEVHASPHLVEAFLQRLPSTPWVPQLRGVTLSPIPIERLDETLDRLQPLFDQGASVSILVGGGGFQIDELESAHQARRPTVRLSWTFGQFHVGTPALTEVPTHAPYDFADLPERIERPREEQSTSIRHYYPDKVGSGWPLDKEYERVKRCLGCGSAEVRKIFDRYSSSDGQFETFSFFKCEIVCRSCGRFTNWEGESSH